MQDVSGVTKADNVNMQVSVKEQQAFINVRMKSWIKCLG